jgi:hypothetical protein
MECGFVGWLLDSQRDGVAGLSVYGQQTHPHRVETQNLASLRGRKRAWRMKCGFVGWLLDSQSDGIAGLSVYGQQTIKSHRVETQDFASLPRRKRAWRMECGFVGWLLDAQSDGVAGLSVYGQRQIDFAAPGQRRRQSHIALIQSDKIALLVCKQDFCRRTAYAV